MSSYVDFTDEQENRITAIYEAVGNLIGVMAPDCKCPQDIGITGPIADMVSRYLQGRGCTVSFPVHVTAYDGETYILETQTQCVKCGCLLDDFVDERSEFVINAGQNDEFRVCFACHQDLMENGEHTQCESCGNCFTPDCLRDNPENGVRELCPYCGEVWCE